ncbi:hypothetical protein AAG570_006423 [Ranatra chinensis]|uniref:Uncharacterized protein n=1 Tax=Ranatra chinensis TaxID=642074 RepID=A0ABD0ZH56_9HEMI
MFGRWDKCFLVEVPEGGCVVPRSVGVAYTSPIYPPLAPTVIITIICLKKNLNRRFLFLACFYVRPKLLKVVSTRQFDSGVIEVGKGYQSLKDLPTFSADRDGVCGKSKVQTHKRIETGGDALERCGQSHRLQITSRFPVTVPENDDDVRRAFKARDIFSSSETNFTLTSELSDVHICNLSK